MDQFIAGTCDTMCPYEEIQMRSRERLLHFYEKNHASPFYAADKNKVVKEFARSAAGNKAPIESELRTPQALKRTVEYLLEDILVDTRKPFNLAYDFIFDRLRAVRQEIVMQNFDTILTIELMEPIVLFLAYSAYKLVTKPINHFDPKICHQHLQECLKKVLSCYDELDLLNVSVDPNSKRHFGYKLANREFIESLYLVFNLDSAHALSRALRLPRFVRKRVYLVAMNASISHWNGNFYKCLRSIEKLPHVLCAIASLKVQAIRRDILLRFSMAYQSKSLTVPFSWLQGVLLYSNLNDCLSDCKYYNIQCDTTVKGVRFSRNEFNDSKPVIISRYEAFVERGLNISIQEVLLLRDLHIEDF